MAREIYYYKRHRSHVRSQTTQGANRDPRRRLNLVPEVGVFARAGPSGVPKPKKPEAKAKETHVPGPAQEGEDAGNDGSAASDELQSSSPESKKPKICLYVKFEKAANSGEAPGKF